MCACVCVCVCVCAPASSRGVHPGLQSGQGSLPSYQESLKEERNTIQITGVISHVTILTIKSQTCPPIAHFHRQGVYNVIFFQKHRHGYHIIATEIIPGFIK